jgi:hypothetical protein
MFQGLRRRLRAAPDNWFAALVAGVVDISYNREADGREFWTPLAVAVDADSSEIKRVFKPRRDPPAEYMGTNFRAVVVKQVTRLSNSIIEGRRSILDGRQNIDRTRFAVGASATLEHDLWLLGMKPRERAFLAGMKVDKGDFRSSHADDLPCSPAAIWCVHGSGSIVFTSLFTSKDCRVHVTHFGVFTRRILLPLQSDRLHH